MDAEKCKRYMNVFFKNDNKKNDVTGRKIQWSVKVHKVYFDAHPLERFVHKRRLHYWLISRPKNHPLRQMPCGSLHKPKTKLYIHTKDDNTQLNESLSFACYIGLIDWKTIVDKRNPEFLYYDDFVNENIRKRNRYEKIELNKFNNFSLNCKPLYINRIEEYCKNFIDIDWEDLTDFSLDFYYTAEKNKANIFTPIFIIEKQTLVDRINALCKKYHVSFLPSIGYNSTRRIFELNELISKHKKPILVMHLGDCDKDGKDMAKAIKERIPLLSTNKHNKIIRIGLTDEQIKHYHLDDLVVDGKIELDALEINDMLTIIESAFKKYTKYSRNIEEIKKRRIKKKIKRIKENLEPEILELDDEENNFNTWLNDYEDKKKKYEKFIERFEKHAWKTLHKKINDIVNKFNNFINEFDELDFDIDEDELENIQNEIEDKFEDELLNQLKNQKFNEKVEDLPYF